MSISKILKHFYREYLALNPLLATSLGYHQWDDSFVNVYTDAYNQKLTKLYQDYLSQVEQVELQSEKERLEADSFKLQAELALREKQLPLFLMPLSPLTNVFVDLVVLIITPGQQPLKSMCAQKKLRQRMKAFGEAYPSLIDRLKEGIEKGVTIPKPLVSRVIQQLSDLLSKRPYFQVCDNGYFRRTMKTYFEPLVSDCKHFLHTQYLSAARETLGLCYLPGKMGANAYQYLIDLNTTRFGLSASEIHRIGLGEVESLLEERDRLQQKLPNPDFREDPSFYPKSGEEALEMYRKAKKEISRTVLPKYFHHLRPSKGYDIKAVPDFLTDYFPAAYYTSPPVNSKRGGVFYVNLGNLHNHPTYMAKSLCCHEGNPGHHFQLTLSQDFRVSECRQHQWQSFIEGWGLYVEGLGEYHNLYSRIGYLDYCLIRATRLVVDTGIHFYGWNHDKCYHFLKGIFPHHTNDQIDQAIYRYVSIPGQALSYKMGELAIRRMRETLVGSQGLSLVKFHRKLMKMGPVPQSVMERYLHRETNSSEIEDDDP